MDEEKTGDSESQNERVVRASVNEIESRSGDNLLAVMQQMAAAIPTDPDTESKLSAFKR